jgi:hypothetical protein
LTNARGYLSDALSYLEPAPAQLIAIGGMSGTGKTVLAALLAPDIGAAPGAIHLRSDLERKALFGVSTLTHLPQSAYSPAVTARVYSRIRDKARSVLSGGYAVILDATWQTEEERASLPALAREAGVRFTGIWLTADTGVLEDRVSARHGDASDADTAVVRAQAQQARIPKSWIKIDASGNPEQTCSQVQAVLRRHAKSN